MFRGPGLVDALDWYGFWAHVNADPRPERSVYTLQRQCPGMAFAGH